MKRRVISSILAVAVLASLLVGCGSSNKESSAEQPKEETTQTETAEETEPEAPAEPEPVTISIGGWPAEESSYYDLYAGYEATLKELYPYITIEKDEYQYSVDSFLPKAASGQLPNLYVTHFTEIDKIISAGYAEDITDTLDRNGVTDTINPDLLAQVEEDGRYYGIPYNVYSMCMLYNVELFKAAGLVDEEGIPVFPTTWDEVAQSAATIKEKTGIPGFFMPTTSNQGGWLFTNIVWSFGGDFEEQVDGKWTAVFDSPEAVAALQYVKDLRWKYDALPDNTLVDVSDFYNMYGTDQVAMGMGHTGMANAIISASGMSKDNMAASVIPEGAGGKTALLGGQVYMVAPGTTPEQQDAIMKWLEVLGQSPVFSEETKDGFDKLYADRAAQGYPVGPMGIRIWTSGERIQEEDAILKKYENVNMKLWNAYCEHSSENLKAEPPVNAQELYKVLDAVIQEVLTNKDADCQALLTKAVTDFQKDYLDKVNN